MEKVVSGLSCPSCGGTIEITEGMDSVDCEFCHTASIVRGEGGISRYFVRDQVTPQKVKQIAYKWFDGIDKAPDLQEKYQVEELFLVFVPFFRVRSKILGWILGKREYNTGRTKHTKNFEHRVDDTYDWNCPACDLREFGVRRVDLEGDVVLPFNREQVEKRGMIFEPTITSSSIIKKADYYFEDRIIAEANVDLITFKNYHQLQKHVSIIYYPLWIMRYRYRNRTYQLVVDAEDGSLLYCRAPGNNLYRVAVLMVSMVFGSLLLTTSIQGMGGSILTLIIILLCMPLMYFGYWQFRNGAEVVFQKFFEETARPQELLLKSLQDMDPKLFLVAIKRMVSGVF